MALSQRAQQLRAKASTLSLPSCFALLSVLHVAGLSSEWQNALQALHLDRTTSGSGEKRSLSSLCPFKDNEIGLCANKYYHGIKAKTETGLLLSEYDAGGGTVKGLI